MKYKITLVLFGWVVLFCTACNWNINSQSTQLKSVSAASTATSNSTASNPELTETNPTTVGISSSPTVIPYPYPGETSTPPFDIPYPGPVKTGQSPPTIAPLTATPFFPPTPIPVVVTVISNAKLDCMPQNSFTKCHDDILGIEFEYPISWGGIEAVLRTSNSGTGYAYNYNFIGITAEHAFLIRGGGRSKDFSEARGGTFTDFRGYGDKPYQDRCNDIKNFVPICREIKPNVILTMHFPNAQFICDPAPGSIPYPIAMIEINLPYNPLINGFVFVSSFLSERLTENLNNDSRNILGFDPVRMPTKCDSESQAEFDNEVNKLIENIKTGSVDNDTNNNIQQLEYMASSVIFYADR